MWQPIETAPKDGSSVLVHWKDGVESRIDKASFRKEDDGDQWHWYAYQCIDPYYDFIIDDPIQWVPLPELPK